MLRVHNTPLLRRSKRIIRKNLDPNYVYDERMLSPPAGRDPPTTLPSSIEITYNTQKDRNTRKCEKTKDGDGIPPLVKTAPKKDSSTVLPSSIEITTSTQEDPNASTSEKTKEGPSDKKQDSAHETLSREDPVLPKDQMVPQTSITETSARGDLMERTLLLSCSPDISVALKQQTITEVSNDLFEDCYSTLASAKPPYVTSTPVKRAEGAAQIHITTESSIDLSRESSTGLTGLLGSPLPFLIDARKHETSELRDETTSENTTQTQVTKKRPTRKRKNQRLKDQLQDLQGKYQQASNHIQVLETENENLKHEITEYKSGATVKAGPCEPERAKTTEMHNYATENADLKVKILDLEDELNLLQARIESLLIESAHTHRSVNDLAQQSSMATGSTPKKKIKAFRGEDGPLSNFYCVSAGFFYKGRRFTSTEQAFQYTKAREHRMMALAAEILAEDSH